MKRIAMAIALSIIALALLSQAPSAPPAPKAGKTNVAVYPIKAIGAVDKSLAATLTSLLTNELTKSPNLIVINESMLDEVIKRQAMNVSDLCDSTMCQVEIGKLVQAQKMVVGDLSKLGSRYLMTFGLMDVTTSAMDFSDRVECACSEDQLDLLVAAAGVKVRNHFGESVPMPSLPYSVASSLPPAPASGPAPAPDAAAIAQAHSLNEKGNTYFAKGDYDFAIQFYTRAIGLNPRESVFFGNRCDAYNRKRDFDSAIQDCSRAIDLNPEYAYAYSQRAESYVSKGNLDLALQDFNRLLSIKSDSADGYGGRGFLYLQKGQYDLAIQDATSIINLDSKESGAYLLRGEAYSMKGNDDLAIKDYNRAIKLNSKDAVSYARRGRAYRASGDYEEAISDFNRALELDPKLWMAYVGLAKLYATATADKFRNGPKAVELATKGCEMTEWKDPDTIATLAAAYAEVGNFLKAIEYQEKAISLINNNEEFKKKFLPALELYKQNKPFRGEIR